MQTQGWKYNFEITKEGEEFIDAYSSHYKRIFGSSAGRPDSETLVMWLTEIRETANFPQTQEKLEKIEGFQKAQAAVDWAVGRRYLEEIVSPPMEDLPGVDPYLSRSPIPHIRELMVELRKAKARGDEAEYARLLDLSLHPEARISPPSTMRIRRRLTQDMLDGMADPTDRQQAMFMEAQREMPDFSHLSGNELWEAKGEWLEQWKEARGLTSSERHTGTQLPRRTWDGDTRMPRRS